MEIRDLLDEKKAVFELENSIEQNTQEVFDMMKDYVSQVFLEQEDVILSMEEKHITVAAYNSLFGISKYDDVSVLRDPELITEAGMEALNETTNWKKIALHESRNSFITGLIVFYSQHNSLNIQQEIGRLYVNKDQKAIFKGLVGGMRIEIMDAEMIPTQLPEIIQSCIEDAFFEGCTYWDEEEEYELVRV
ncbi:hypothetical protein [Pontibacillus yanchengensis]|uniref:Uncharacterized protein n=1 Tax=Pontibacillus yanchengensis Y32 TaxID=1385514 RepID=A0A0A2TEP8_9BACI|nr:hypothetical protein [Pontibacillus yanchengensis]KGP72863.1 hypothetical protein N782_10300 [Pontibacillus yanchengensis Y32]